MGSLTRAMVGLVMLAGLTATTPLHADEIEYVVKAEFIERFTRFVDWPPQSLTGSDGPFVMCIIGDTPMESQLSRLARERRIKDRPIELRHVKPGVESPGCNMLFIAPSERSRLRQILARSSGRPVLTVSDSEGFAQQGVLINLFVNEDGHVRFEICSNQLRKSGLNISAQLLRLARLVEEQP